MKNQKKKQGLYLQVFSENLIKDGDPLIENELMGSINTNNIRENLRMLTALPHLAGTEQNHKLAREIKQHWENAGLDHVTMTPYRVLLSYPNMSDLNYVELLDERNQTKYKSDLREPVLTPEENVTGVVPPFNAYSAPGDIYGDLVYVNYGRVEDYEYLENKTINISGKIAFARYGKIFRGDKVIDFPCLLPFGFAYITAVFTNIQCKNFICFQFRQVFEVFPSQHIFVFFFFPIVFLSHNFHSTTMLSFHLSLS
ncbi:N-acetylated-alpha-linked acidic dipeptidase 2-like [Mercenaria mercenaria]|uniref:N-acetylated-alpha-linked acidic dipeptidase 2-like n=1 Tax=Mercenaria mercenaria TaxID=6596 RepID=UPI00234E7949|nr:N-acetylated-alpha-linked acidic dipeptidase 2-like [Mercenaria mercenaria]